MYLMYCRHLVLGYQFSQLPELYQVIPHRGVPNRNNSDESEYIRKQIVPFLINRMEIMNIRIRLLINRIGGCSIRVIPISNRIHSINIP